MKHLEGAAAPFSHFPLCLPGYRVDTLLAQALAAYKEDKLLESVLAVEYVCRRMPEKALPAMLRARVVAAFAPHLTARAWFVAWTCDPENPALQDALLQCWLGLNALAQVRDLGKTFLPMRCRLGSEASLLTLLARAGMVRVGACWLTGMVAQLRVYRLSGSAQAEKVSISDQCAGVAQSLFITNRQRWQRPARGQVFSIAFDDGELLQGSPLIYPASSPLSLAQVRPARMVDIVVPVFRGMAQVQTCVHSILRSLPHNRTRARLIVIDDASPEAELSAWLDQLAAQKRCVLLRNRHNLGFVESVNRGLRQHASHDVMLLNADTEVQGDWLDRLGQSLYASPDIASVTPWSNNGEISSFPEIGRAVAAPAGDGLGQMDRIASGLSADFPDQTIPACCGFAMLIRREVLNRIGLLDGAGFYRGYSEEVDWCMRARQAGYVHKLAVGVFVSHAGGISFGMEKVLRVRQNRALIMARYPDYYAQYHGFVRTDPLAQVRAMFVERIKSFDPGLLKAATLQGEGGLMPPALPSAGRRIAVWQNHPASRHAGKVLHLARLLANGAVPEMRLLVFGQASEALWHTGVIDVLPPATGSQVLFSDMTLLGLAGCEAILAEPGKWQSNDLRYYQIDQEFDPAKFLGQFVPDACPETGGLTDLRRLDSAASGFLGKN